MDHLPFPQGTQAPLVRFVGMTYDKGDFATYPNRQVMDAAVRRSSFLKETPGKYLSFFQTWLYFGCLSQIFKVVGLPFHQEEFLSNTDQGTFVTSAPLNAYIDKWRKKEPRADKITNKKRMAFLHPIREILKRVRESLHGPLQAFQRHVDDHADAELKASFTNITLSIAALAYTFHRVSDDIYAMRSDRHGYNWGVDWALKEKMQTTNWCKALIHRFLNSSSLDANIFISFMEFPRALENHDACVSTVCCGKMAKTAEYSTRHVCKGCDCTFHEMPAFFRHVIHQKGIPLARWSEGGIEAIQYEEGMSYVAISHVWSDGKGNEKNNSLPECQLRKIHDNIQKLYATPLPDCNSEEKMFGPRKSLGPRHPDRQPVGFWMDTLCVPAGKGEENKRLRKLAIQQMREIYESSDRVLVLDDRIEQLSVSSSYFDRAVRLIVSNWQSRIWTLQEGVMAHQLCFQFDDGALTYERFQKEEESQRKAPSPGCFQRITENILVILSIGLEFATPSDLSYADLFPALILVAVNRMTTNFEDETICLGTLMRMDIEPLLNTQSKYTKDELKEMTDAEKTAEDMRVCDARMETFICRIRKFPSSLIFSELPRLSHDGFRWAPRSYLGQSGIISSKNTERLRTASEGNAEILFSTPQLCEPDCAVGLLVGMPGIMLQSGDLSQLRTGEFVIHEKGYKAVEYRVSLVKYPEDDSGLYGSELEENKFVLVTVAAPVRKCKHPLAAVFGELIGKTEAGIHKVRHLCLAHVQIARQKKLGDEHYTSSSSSEESVWLSGNESLGNDVDEFDEGSDEGDESEDEDDESEDEDDESEDEDLNEGDNLGGKDLITSSKQIATKEEVQEKMQKVALETNQHAVIFGKVLFSRNNKWCIV